MSAAIWLSAAGVFLLLELLTGTFFCLAFSAAALAGAASVLFTQSPLLQLASAAAFGMTGCIAAALLQMRRKPGAQESMDAGNRVTVTEWKDGHAAVRYRGAIWDAVTEKEKFPLPGEWIITGSKGSTLILSREDK